MLIQFIARNTSSIYWVTSEAKPEVKDFAGFIQIATEIVQELTKPEVDHHFQNAQKHWEILEDLLDQERAKRQFVIITPEPQLYHDLCNGERVIAVKISRVMDVVDWKTLHHDYTLPPPPSHVESIFLDTVAFTGRTIEVASKVYNIHTALVECEGKYAQQKAQKLGIELRSGEKLIDYAGVWHIDDLVKPIQTDADLLPASKFLQTIYPLLMQAHSPQDFGTELNKAGITRQQTSPNLFLELARPQSFLARSFYRQVPHKVIILLRVLEKMYTTGESS